MDTTCAVHAFSYRAQTAGTSARKAKPGRCALLIMAAAQHGSGMAALQHSQMQGRQRVAVVGDEAWQAHLSAAMLRALDRLLVFQVMRRIG